MIKEKKEEGEEGAAPAKGAEKGAAKGAEKAPAKGAEKGAADKSPDKAVAATAKPADKKK